MKSTFQIIKNKKRPHLLKSSSWVPEKLENVFAFFSQPQNLEKLTPTDMNFKIKKPILKMHPHTRIEYDLSLRGIPLKWRSLIIVWQPPYRFVDLQTFGPYQLWEHTHSFESMDGGTLISDHVQFSFAFDKLLFPLIAHDLKRVFEFRQKVVTQLFT